MSGLKNVRGENRDIGVAMPKQANREMTAVVWLHLCEGGFYTIYTTHVIFGFAIPDTVMC